MLWLLESLLAFFPVSGDLFCDKEGKKHMLGCAEKEIKQFSICSSYLSVVVVLNLARKEIANPKAILEIFESLTTL